MSRLDEIEARSTPLRDYNNAAADPRVASALATAEEIVVDWYREEWNRHELHSMIATAILDTHRAYAADLAALLRVARAAERWERGLDSLQDIADAVAALDAL